jgi:hypothetical protein
MTAAARMREFISRYYPTSKRLDGMFGQYMTEHRATNGASIIIADSGLWSAYGGDGALVSNGSDFSRLESFVTGRYQG